MILGQRLLSLRKTTEQNNQHFHVSTLLLPFSFVFYSFVFIQRKQHFNPQISTIIVQNKERYCYYPNKALRSKERLPGPPDTPGAGGRAIGIVTGMVTGIP